jgi:hypothetical protein
VIRIERVDLPAGLRAIAQRDRDGILVIYVAEGLDARRQRAAVMEAVRASRRAGWRGAVPAGVAAFGAVRLLVRRVAARFRTQPVAAAGWAGGAAAVIAAGVVGVVALSMAAGPHRPATAFGSRPGVSVSGSAPAGGRPDPSGQPGGGSSGQRGSGGSGGSGGTSPAGGAVAPPASRTAGAPGPTGGPPGGPTSSPPGGGGSSSPPSQTPPASGSTPPVAPTSAPAPPQTPKPSPSPSSPPPGSHSRPCIHLLIIGICL